MKKSILFPLILLCFQALPQAFISGEAGTRLGINAGYIYKNAVLKAGGLFPYTRTETLSNIAYAALGYQIGNEINITPLVGISHYHTTDFTGLEQGCDPKIIDKPALLYSLAAGKDMTSGWGGSFRIYVFATYSENIFYGTGLRIFIK